MLNHFKHKAYMGSIEFSKEDNCYYGKVINICDLVNYEANSVSNLKKSFIEAIDDYLEMILNIESSLVSEKSKVVLNEFENNVISDAFEDEKFNLTFNTFTHVFRKKSVEKNR